MDKNDLTIMNDVIQLYNRFYPNMFVLKQKPIPIFSSVSSPIIAFMPTQENSRIRNL